MKKAIAAVICEYNPFHLGHEYLLSRIREEIGVGGVIVAIMSGNFTERGEAALFDKYLRAEAAILGGADAVFELPYPFSASGAEFFASAGVKIAAALGATHLYFGAETPDRTAFERMAEIQNNPDYEAALKSRTAENSDRPYAAVRAEVLAEWGISAPESPNDILAAEYVRAIRKNGYHIIPRPIQRIGAGYHDNEEQPIMSASGIRARLKIGEPLSSVPDAVRPLYEAALAEGNYTDGNLPSVSVLAYLRLTPPEHLKEIAGLSSGLAHRLADSARNALTLTELHRMVATKKYTDAHIRRATLYSMTGVTYADLDQGPLYTQLLAMRKDAGFLAKQCTVPVVTKPASYKKLPKEARAQYELTLCADALYTLALKTQKSAGEYLRRSPTVLNL
ncbi:MAG: nucleotidyltransferase family protein [Clostridia bacterium]|nr:nucleotidyltransferase family protein [Clostridia bacterium]